MAKILIRRRLKWIGHVIRRDQNSITKTVLHWTLEESVSVEDQRTHGEVQ